MENEKRGQDLANIFRKLNFGYETFKKKLSSKFGFWVLLNMKKQEGGSYTTYERKTK
jgi:hypothetical protein